MESLTLHSRKKLGAWLLHLGLLTKRQMDVAMEAQALQPDMLVGEILIQKGYITRQELDATLALQEVLDGRSQLKDFAIAPKTLSLLPEQFCFQHEVLPLAQIAMRVLVATVDGRNFQALDKITLHTGLIVVSIEVGRDELFSALGKAFNREVIPPAIVSPPKQSPADPTPPIQRTAGGNANSSVIVDLVNSVLDEALQLNASDIHLIPYANALEVRCRADGIMRKVLDVPKHLEAAVIKRIQQIAAGSNPEQRRAQGDGGSFRLYGESTELVLSNVELRLSSLQTLWGEYFKIQIVCANTPLQSLSGLGMDPEDLLSYKRMLRGRGGLIVLTGPRGSGKHSLLQASIGYMDKLSNHILSIESSIATPIAGVTQIALNPRQGLTLEVCLGQALEQSPDILIIDEVATPSQLEAAIKASLKGVLIMTTLPASSTGVALAQLLSIGLPLPLLSASLRGIVGQQLLRRNCSKCLIEYAASASERAFLGAPHGAPLFLARGLGCVECMHTGYHGQMGIFELLPITPAVAELLANPHVSPAALEAQAGVGITRLQDDAKRKVMQGFTSIPEVFRVLGEWSGDEEGGR